VVDESWVGQQRAVSWVARHSCRTGLAALARGSDLLREVGHDAFASLDAARHLRAGPGFCGSA